MKKQNIIDAYVRIRTIDNTISDDVLDFMKEASIEALDKKEDHTAYYMAEIKSLRNIINNLKGKLESSTIKQNVEQVLENIKYEHNYNVLRNTGRNWNNEMFLLNEILKKL